MGNFTELPRSVHHEIFRNLPLMSLRRLSQTSRQMRRSTYSIPQEYKTKIDLFVEDEFMPDHSLSCTFCPMAKKEALCDLPPGMEIVMSHRFHNHEELCVAVESLLRLAHVGKMTMWTTFPRHWNNWMPICAAVIRYSNRDALVALNLLKTDRSNRYNSPPTTEKIVFNEYRVVARACYGSLLADFHAHGVSRVSIRYNIEAYIIDIVPFEQFRYLNLRLCFSIPNLTNYYDILCVLFDFFKDCIKGKYPKSCYIISVVMVDPGWDLVPIDKELTELSKGLNQANKCCYMRDEESDDVTLWQTIAADGFRINWQSLYPQKGHVMLRIMTTDDSEKGTPTVRRMDKKMKKLRKNSPFLQG